MPKKATAKGLEKDLITPEVKAQTRATIEGKEQAPTTRQQSAQYPQWRAIADAPADPFNVERIPISQLRQMRRDPMIGFALHFIKMPLIRAPWYIKCEDAQIAAFLDYSLRKIYARLVLQYMLCLDFGFVAIAKRFSQEPVLGTYFDPQDPGETEDPDLFPNQNVPADLRGKSKPIWSEGSILPITWKPFVPLPPEDVEPIYSNQGEFDGIKFVPRFQVQAGGIGGKTGSNEGEMEIDVTHSLWVTHDKDSQFGNIFGYPRIGYAYQHWFSYWHRHYLADRHFEKDSDPPTVVRHPEGHFQDPNTGDTIAFRDLALDIGDRVRAGSTIAIPSEVYTNFEDRPSQMYKWDLDFLKGGGNFEAFEKAFDYLDVAKLRALWVPEQALIEGKGGQSSRNVASTFGDAFQDSQSVLMADFDDHLNRFVIPQLLWANFPEFEGEAVKVTRGFASRDIETIRQLLQLVGQSDITQLGLDTRTILEELNIPVMDPATQAAEANRAAQQNNPGQVEAIPGQQAGVVPTGGAPNNPSNILPFSYVQPNERIYMPTVQLSNGLPQDHPLVLSDNFIASLPGSEHYADRIIKQYAKQTWDAWFDLYSGQYKSFADFLESEGIELSDDGVELADVGDKVRRWLTKWTQDNDIWNNTVARSVGIFRSVMNRAALLSTKGLEGSWDADSPEAHDWLVAHVQSTINNVRNTINNNLAGATQRIIEENEGITAPELAAAIRAHFSDFPQWEANRLARTEIRDLWNGAKLMAAASMGVSQVQARDGQRGPTDEECEERDGEVFQISDALDVHEHPNGTLEWKLLSSNNLRIRTSENEEVLASYDSDKEIIYLADNLDENQRKSFIHSVGDQLDAND